MTSSFGHQYGLYGDDVFGWGHNEDGTEVFGGEVSGYDIFVCVRPDQLPNMMRKKIKLEANEHLRGWPNHRIKMDRDLALPGLWNDFSVERKLEVVHGVAMFAIFNGLEQKARGVRGINYV